MYKRKHLLISPSYLLSILARNSASTPAPGPCAHAQAAPTPDRLFVMHDFNVPPGRKQKGGYAMKMLVRIVVAAGLFVAGSSSFLHAQSAPAGKIRTYYVAADEVNWDYAPSGRDEAMGRPFDALQKGYAESGPHQIGPVYKKAIYREYTDDTFTVLKKRSAEDTYLGLLGPVLHAEVGDTSIQHASARSAVPKKFRRR